MAYKRIHLRLTPHPLPTSDATIDYACGLAACLGAELYVSSARISVRTPNYWLASAVIDEAASDIEKKAAAKSRELENYVSGQSAAFGVRLSITPVVQAWPYEREEAIALGRTSDLCIVGKRRAADDTLFIPEEWIFQAGRPCLVYPEETERPFRLENVTLCWDASRTAARAIGDAMPLLQVAKNVNVVTVQGEKDIPFNDIRTPLIGLLKAHGVRASAEDVSIGENSIGEAIFGYAQDKNADLIVMGAFGHSRLKEFLLGGATKELLNQSTFPLLLSH